jgi:hypothetical protein
MPLPESLQYQLSLYALAAGAAGVSVLALSKPAEAQIVYTPLHKVIGPGTEVPLDFDGDGNVDLTIVDRFFLHTSGGRTLKGALLSAVPSGQPYGGIAKRYYNAAGAFPRGQKIGTSRDFNSGSGCMGTVWSLGEDYYFGSWMPYTTNQYLGVRFSMAGKQHFAWVRLSVEWLVPQRGIKALLTGYAYETQADKPIRTGDTGQNDADEGPTSQMFPAPAKRQQPTLGALALGASGIASWRRDESR